MLQLTVAGLADRRDFHRLGGAHRHTGSAAIAAIEINFGDANRTHPEPELNRFRFAVFTATATNHLFLSDTGVADFRVLLPGRLLARSKHRRLTGCHAVAAERTFAKGEINFRKATGSGDKDGFRAGLDAALTARAIAAEIDFSDAPWRP